MNELEIFKYALYPSGANYSDADLKKRVVDSTQEIKVLLGDISKSFNYSIFYHYFNDHDYLWLVAVATKVSQPPLDWVSQQETISAFAHSVQERVSSLPVILNSIALEIDAQRYTIHPSKIEEKELASLILKQSGKRRIIKQNGHIQYVLFPDCDPFKLQPEPRQIRFKIDSLSKYEAMIYEVEDSHFVITKTTKMPLILGGNKFNQELFNRLADRLYREAWMELIVNAKVEIINGQIAEYHFHSE
jgi:hypothetical protein